MRASEERLYVACGRRREGCVEVRLRRGGLNIELRGVPRLRGKLRCILLVSRVVGGARIGCGRGTGRLRIPSKCSYRGLTLLRIVGALR